MVVSLRVLLIFFFDTVIETEKVGFAGNAFELFLTALIFAIGTNNYAQDNGAESFECEKCKIKASESCISLCSYSSEIDCSQTYESAAIESKC